MPSLLASILLLLLLLKWHCMSLVISGDHSNSDKSRIVHLLLPYWHCNASTGHLLTIESNIKLTTVVSGVDGGSQSRRLCSNPIAPIGKQIPDSRGVTFWLPKIRVTKLSGRQKLSIVNTRLLHIDGDLQTGDTREDLTSQSHNYPVLRMLSHSHVRLYWNCSGSDCNWPVNITLSRYARYRSEVNATMRELLCQLYDHAWCQSGSQCVSRISCSLQSDCFDKFDEPNKCSASLPQLDTNHSSSVLLSIQSWPVKHLPWLPLLLLPLLLLALLKLCSQQGQLDIDDNYDYKCECSSEKNEEASDSDTAAQAAGAYYSYPTMLASSSLVDCSPPPLPRRSKPHTHQKLQQQDRFKQNEEDEEEFVNVKELKLQQQRTVPAASEYQQLVPPRPNSVPTEQHQGHQLADRDNSVVYAELQQPVIQHRQKTQVSMEMRTVRAKSVTVAVTPLAGDDLYEKNYIVV